MANVKLKNVYKIYPGIYTNDGNDLTAVNDFSLDIKDGEVIALVGPSGCGRTSTLMMLAGLEEISKGEVYFGDVLINNVHPKDRGIAMVFQNYALFPHLTIFDNIAFGLKPVKFTDDAIKEKVENIARILDIWHLLDRKPSQISGGQRQRTALARAFIREAKVMLLDDPVSNLDPKLRVWARTELLKLHKQFKSTYIYVTHNQDDAMVMADRIVVMKDGRIEQVGTPEELYFKPRNLFVAGFIGSPQMNFWNAEIDGKKVIKGIRPEDMYIVGHDDPGVPQNHPVASRHPSTEGNEIDATVEVREFLGDRTYLHCKDSGHDFTVRVSPDCDCKPGDKIKIAVNPDKIYLFDKETELALKNK